MGTSPYQTLGDIRSAVLADFKESTASQIVTLVDRWINQAQEEVILRKKRDFLNKTYTVDLAGSVDVGTAQVTSGGTSITYTSTTALPVVTTDREFSVKVDGYAEVYRVSSFNTSTITLASTYKGDTSTAASLVFFQNAVFLDSDIRSVHQVYHDHLNKLMEGKGASEFRDLVRRNPAYTGYGEIWSLFNHDTTYTKAKLEIYPFPDSDYTLKIDANRFIPELTSASQEPIIPLQHRQLLYHYAKRKMAEYHGDTTAIQIADADFNRWLNFYDSEFFGSRQLPTIKMENARWKTRNLNSRRRRIIDPS